MLEQPVLQDPFGDTRQNTCSTGAAEEDSRKLPDDYPPSRFRLQMPARQSCHARAATATKKRLHSRRVEPVIGQSPNPVWQRAREENTPSAGWTVAEGGGFGADPVLKDPSPREEVRGRSTSTQPIWACARASASSAGSCQPCARRRYRARVLTKNKASLLGGRARPKAAEYFGSRGEEQNEQREGGTRIVLFTQIGMALQVLKQLPSHGSYANNAWT